MLIVGVRYASVISGDWSLIFVNEPRFALSRPVPAFSDGLLVLLISN